MQKRGVWVKIFGFFGFSMLAAQWHPYEAKFRLKKS
jgi:hypothetical protein